MKQLFSLFIGCLMAAMSLAQEVYTVENLPNVHYEHLQQQIVLIVCCMLWSNKQALSP